MARSALIVADMVSAYDFEDADRVAASAAEAVGPMQALIERGYEEDVEVLWVNDNYGDFSTSPQDLIRRAREGNHPELVEPVLPREGSDFLLKVRHSVFYGTPLDYLFRDKDVDRVVLCGQVTEQCILYSALDAYVRGYTLAVARDAVAHIHPQLADAAFEMMERNMHADLCAAGDCRLV
jgi:nicotinamidase-related amidase